MQQTTAIETLPVTKKAIDVSKGKVYCRICKYTIEVVDADEFVEATLLHYAERPGHVLMLKNSKAFS
jgi:hypothetical protein